ncbi:MAG: GNAT family N-acetyltransferase [Candidatus Aenigmarchaeota archaeon]|nr:GNAT family N-acetyltransferase [Candidatus Aenigmarchaeota archaeon]
MVQKNKNTNYSFTSYIITKELRNDPEILSITRSVANLVVESFVDINPGLTVESYLKHIDKITDKQPLYTEVIKNGNKIIGAIVYTNDEIIDIAVKENYRNQGCGKKLVEKAIYNIKETISKQSKIKTKVFTPTGIRLFKAEGFVPNYYGSSEKSPYLVMEHEIS